MNPEMQQPMAAEQPAPQDSSQQEMGAPAAGIIKILYGGEAFEAVKSSLEGAKTNNELLVLIPTLAIGGLMKYEQQAGVLPFEEGLKAMAQVSMMLAEDAIKSVTQQQLDASQTQMLIRNCMAVYLKKHKDIVPPEVEATLRQAADAVQQDVISQGGGQEPEPAEQEGALPEAAPPTAQGMGGLLSQGVQ